MNETNLFKNHFRRESTSSNGSNGGQIILEPGTGMSNGLPRTSKPEVSLILTSSPLPIPKTKILLPTSAAPEVIHCNLCQTRLNSNGNGIDLDLHQREYCVARQRGSSLDESSADLLSPKRPKLSLISQQPSTMVTPSVVVSAGKMLFTGGGIVSLSKIGSGHHNQTGLLQIAQHGLHSGGGIVTTASTSLAQSSTTKLDLQSIIPTTVFSIPGIPTPNLTGVLTNIKPNSMPLFSLPGKRLDLPNLPNHPVANEAPKPSKPIPFVLGIPGPYSQQSTLTTHTLSPGASKPFLMSPPPRSTNPLMSMQQHHHQQQQHLQHQQPLQQQLQKSSPTSASCQIKIEVSEPSPSSETPPTPTTESVKSEDSKFLRPNSLPLTPGSFKVKKQVMMTPGAASLISPETPRPRKSYALQYQNGTAYTYLVRTCQPELMYHRVFLHCIKIRSLKSLRRFVFVFRTSTYLTKVLHQRQSWVRCL